MPSKKFDTFPYGLDTRRSVLTSVPGTLEVLQNAHINQGAEIEKRKAFVPLGYLPTGCFGLEVVTSGLITFGSGSIPAGLPPGVSYQQLASPSGAAMTGVVFSCSFAGMAFVIAKYADGSQYVFYNGAQVVDFTSGTTAIDFTNNNNIAAALVGLVNLSGTYTAVQHASPNQNLFDVTALPGNDFSVAITDTTTSGTISAQKIHGPITPVGANPSVGLFQIVAGSTAFASQTLLFSSQPNDGDTFTIHGTVNKTYTYKTTLTPTEGQILIGGSLANAIQNAVDAINHTGTPGTQYDCAAANADVSFVLSTLVANEIVATALVINVGTAGNAVTTTASSGGRFVWGAGTLLGAGNNYMTQITANSTQLINTGVYPNGVPFSANGSLSQFAADISVAINAYSGTSFFTAIASGVTIQISSSANNAVQNGGAIVTTAEGNVCVGQCSFQLTGSNFTLSSITDASLVNLLSTTLVMPTAGATLALFNTAVVANINALTGTSGYLSYTDGVTIWVSKAKTSSTDAPITITVTSTGNINTVGSGLTAVATPASLGVQKVPSENTFFTITTMSVAPSGGIPPYTFLWSVSPSTVVSGVSILFLGSGGSINNKIQNPALSYFYGTKHSSALTLICTCNVTDFNGNKVTSNPVVIQIPAF